MPFKNYGQTLGWPKFRSLKCAGFVDIRGMVVWNA